MKFDKDRDLYLGVSVKAPIGKWAQGRDVCWYQKPSELDKIHIEKKKEEKTKEPKHKHKHKHHHHHHHHKHKHHHKHRSSSSSFSSESEKEDEEDKIKSKKASKVSDEIAEIKRRDEEAMMMRLLGKNKMNDKSKFEKGEMQMLLQKGKLETDQYFVERTQGLGAAPTFSEKDLNEEAKDEDDDEENEREKQKEMRRKKAIPAPLVNPFGDITGERMSMDDLKQRDRSPRRRK